MAVPTLLAQFGIDPASASATSAVLTPTAVLPVGTFVVVGMCSSTATPPTMTITDSGTNTWTRSQGRTGSGMDTVIFTSVLAAALTTLSTITITSTVAMTRHTVAVGAFSDVVTGPATYGTVLEGPNQTPVTGGTVTPSATSSVFAVMGYVSSGRVFTPATGWVALTKHLSTAGSGNRGVQIAYRDGAAATPYATIGTLDTSGVMLTGLGYIPQGGAVSSWRAGLAKVWTGSAWATKPVKAWNGTAWVPGAPKVFTG